MKNNKIFILIDYRDTFYSSTKEVAGSMDTEKLRTLFKKRNYDVSIERFSEVDLKSTKYKNSFILYQSSEDPNIKYKDYIEDVLLGLEMRGAILIPDFYKFRAHHNKNFMEILRDVSDFRLIQNISSKKFGTLEELKKSIGSINLPAVIKPASGSRSRGIFLSNTENQTLRLAKKTSFSFSFINLKRLIKGTLSGKGYKPISNFRNKFIIQDFISGLSCDYKILVYSDRWYVLKRKNRKKDFRASGSGLFSFPEKLPDGLLDFAEKIFIFFSVPFASFDIATKNGKFYILEFQFLSFGQYALEKSAFFFKKNGSCWEIVRERSDLERNLVRSICVYIDRYTKKQYGDH